MKRNIITLLLISFFCLTTITASANLIDFDNQQNQSTVSPNPVATTATVRFYNPNNETHEMVIYDLIGSKVISYPNINTKSFRIDVDDLTTGIYFYFILKNDNERVSSGRIIVRK